MPWLGKQMAQCVPIIVRPALWAEEAARAGRHPKREDHSPALKSDPSLLRAKLYVWFCLQF